MNLARSDAQDRFATQSAPSGLAKSARSCPLSEGFCCKTPLRVAGGLACEFLVVGLRCFPIEGVGAFGMCMQIQNVYLDANYFYHGGRVDDAGG